MANPEIPDGVTLASLYRALSVLDNRVEIQQQQLIAAAQVMRRMDERIKSLEDKTKDIEA